jgi:hypothetical protein
VLAQQRGVGVAEVVQLEVVVACVRGGGRGCCVREEMMQEE